MTGLEKTKSNFYRKKLIEISDISMSSRLVFLLLGLALVQGVYGVLQLVGLRPSLHHLYPVTGSFFNPGPFGCFLALTFPLALAESIRGCAILRWLGAAVLLLDAMLLPITLSRTAWIAAALGAIVVFLPEILSFFRRYKFLFPLSLIGMLLLSVTLFSLKANSAHGRFLMWKVALTAMDAHPFSGVGPEYVAGAYGDAQERYFSSELRPEREILVADAPDFVFNEYLQTAIAYGWGVTLLLILLLTAALITAWRCKNRSIAGCVVAVMTVMTASYPLQFPLSAVVIALILVSSFLSTTMIDIRILGSLAAISGILFLCHPLDRREINQTFNTGLSLHKAGKWMQSNKVMMELLRGSADPMPLNIIGKNWQQLGRKDSAVHYFNRASARCPNRLYPHYLLMKLYADSTSFSAPDALREASALLNMSVKVPSPAIDDMRSEARQLIQNLKNETTSEDK